MAPNIKKLSLLASSLQDLDIQVQPKYLPLTHPQEEEAQQTTTHREKVETRTPASDSASYWDWPADVPTEDVEEPKTKDLFSASSLEANLIKDSQRDTSTDIIYATDAAAAVSDDYWCERVEPEPSSTTTATKPQHDTYWSWPADPQDARIKAILQDEKFRALLSAQHIVDNIVASDLNKSGCSQAKPETDSYWTWDSSPSMVVSETLDEVYSQAYWEWKSDDRSKAEINRTELIQSILEAEACRQVVSLTKIEENLKKASTTLPKTASTTQASSDDYWSWTSTPAEAKTEEIEGYWDWSAKPVTTGAEKGYWDW